MKEDDSATKQDEALQKLLTEMLDESCPTKLSDSECRTSPTLPKS